MGLLTLTPEDKAHLLRMLQDAVVMSSSQRGDLCTLLGVKIQFIQNFIFWNKSKVEGDRRCFLTEEKCKVLLVKHFLHRAGNACL